MKKLLAVMMAAVLAMCFYGCGEKESSGDEISVSAKTGTYIGHDNNGIAEFLGVSYAAPIERWKAPQDPETTSDDRIVCDEWGPSCMQIDDEVEVASQWKMDEDCLDLNVWTKNVETTGKPVMVFIHGGGNWRGGTYDPLYDGEYFVRNLEGDNDVVMVTMNFRLGIFGSLNMSGLEGYTDEYADAVNLTTLDQIQALKWVHENIEAFGGNPENVTIFGQSAGGGAVAALLTIDKAQDYFRKAICESGNLFNRQITVEKSEENAKIACDILGVDSVDDLMKLSDDDILENYQEELHSALFHLGTMQRVIDGDLIPEDGYGRLLDGYAKDKAVMVGNTDGEKDYYCSDWDNYPNAITDESVIDGKIETAAKDTEGAATSWSVLDHPEIVDEYMEGYDDVVKRKQDLINDMNFRQTNIFLADALSEHSDSTYMYYWTWKPDVEECIEYNGTDNAEVSPWGRAMHCMELEFVLNTTEGYCELNGDPEKLPEDMLTWARETWYAFAKNGDPNNDYISEWKNYTKADRYMMVMGDEWTCEKDPRAEDTAILEKAAPNK